MLTVLQILCIYHNLLMHNIYIYTISYNIHFQHQVDDEQQSITLSIFHYYYWNDPRIIANQTHMYWRPEQKGYKLALDGSFVEKCLWFPRLTFSNVVGLSSWKPTPEKLEGPPLNFYLSKNGKVEVIMSRFHLTIGCKMDFSNFPFDNQVAFLDLRFLSGNFM